MKPPYHEKFVPDCGYCKDVQGPCRFMKEVDPKVNHPAHYTMGGIEVIEAIDAWGLNFARGNAIKYIARAAHKGSELEDLKKARWYINHEIDRLAK